MTCSSVFRPCFSHAFCLRAAANFSQYRIQNSRQLHEGNPLIYSYSENQRMQNTIIMHPKAWPIRRNSENPTLKPFFGSLAGRIELMGRALERHEGLAIATDRHNDYITKRPAITLFEQVNLLTIWPTGSDWTLRRNGLITQILNKRLL